MEVISEGNGAATPPTPAGGETPDTLSAIYHEDGEFYRYRDQLKWSRFQTASAIEGGVLYTLFQANGVSAWERVALIVLAILLVALLFRLARLDQIDAAAHLRRMARFESETPYERSGRRPFMGAQTTYAAMAVIMAFNVALLIKYSYLAMVAG